MKNDNTEGKTAVTLDTAARPEQLTLKKIIRLEQEELIELLWTTDRQIYKILISSINIHEARNSLFKYLNGLERCYFNIYSDNKLKNLHDLEKRHAKNCVRILKNIIRTENENLAGASALAFLWKLAHKRPRQMATVTKSFLCELLFLFLGINGKFAFYRDKLLPEPELDTGEKPGIVRSHFLDAYAEHIRDFVRRYTDGLDPAIVKKNRAMKKRILDYFKASEKDWHDYRWQLKHVISKRKTIEDLLELTPEEREGLEATEKHGVPVQITPYYLSLFNPKASSGIDRTVRAQVLPNRQYVESLIKAIASGKDLDFMGEHSTTPIDGITRRYVQVLILKAFDSCPQICVYCQRNWELKSLCRTRVNRSKLAKAIEWVEKNENIVDLLLTGGDPLTLDNSFLEWILKRLSKIKHLTRIRISTRIPVTMPCRITDKFVRMVSRYNDFGRRELCFVTHYESPLEMTPESLAAIKKLRAAGFNIYNQQVFTYYNSRKFETFALRKLLKRCGVDPYYCFNTKGKTETKAYRVPIARLLQEWTEESRLLPGLDRTDTPVFNVPTLGKSYLQSWQDHEIIMVMPDGRRVYRFYPWESMLSLTEPYLYTDVPIYHYLKRLLDDGENVNDYYSIWYYF